MFCDSRLFVAVHPALEYKLVEAGKTALAYAVGDAAELQFTAVAAAGDAPAPPNCESEVERRLYALSTKVCALTDEHLKHLEMKWIDFVAHAHACVRQETRLLAQELAQVRKRCAVPERHGRTLALRARLDACVTRHRTARPPAAARSAELCSAGAELRSALAGAYGTAPTANLLALKHAFADQMARIEADVSRSFDMRLQHVFR